jgi:hypothetical protein
METITLKKFLKELKSYENTTLRGCKVYIEIEGVLHPLSEDCVDAYGDNTLRIKLIKQK